MALVDVASLAKVSCEQISMNNPSQQHFQHVFCLLDKLLPGSYGYLSTSNMSDTAIVFVHGFDGDPADTWTDFQTLMDTKAGIPPEWQNADSFFFTYRSTKASIDDSLDGLREFIDSLYPTLSHRVVELLPEHLQLPATYTKLILVGHSEGGAVIRALVASLGSRWETGGVRSSILDSRVALFAPAHFGFMPTSWLGALASITGIAGLMGIAISYSTPASEMRDKTALLQVNRITEKLFEKHPRVEAFAAHVLFGVDDHFVIRQYYLQDCRHTPEKGRNHQTICKPSLSYLRPLSFVIGDCPK